MNDDTESASGSDQSLEQMLDSTLSATFDEMQKEPAETDAPAEGARQRDESGRFTAKQPAVEAGALETTVETEETPAEITEETDQGKDAEAALAQQASKPPASWSAAAKAEFGKLPPLIQQEVLKRESDVTKGFEQRAVELKQFEPIKQILAPRANDLIREFGSVSEAISEMFKVADYAKNNGPQFIRDFAEEAGIDLASLIEPDAAPVARQATDPAVVALSQRLQQFESQISQAQRQAAQQQVDVFAKSHPHFDAVRTTMGQLIEAGIASDMQDAYDRAVYMDPGIRQKLMEADQAAKAKAAAEAAAKARKTAGTVLSGKGQPSGLKNGAVSMDATMSAVYDRINAG